MKLYILITLFIFMCIFLSNSNHDYFGLVNEHFQNNDSNPTPTIFDYEKSRSTSINKIIQNKLMYIEYYIGRSDVDVEFDLKSRNTKYKKFISHLNVLMDTIIQYNNEKFRELNDQYVRRFINKFYRKREKDCIRYKVEVTLYNTKNYSTNEFLFEFCLKNNKFIIDDVPMIAIGEIDYEREEVVPYEEKPISDFKEIPILQSLVDPKDDYILDVDDKEVKPCDFKYAQEKNYDWHPSYLQIDDIDHSYDFVTLRGELLV